MNSIRVFPFFHFIFLLKWNKQSSREDTRKTRSSHPAYNFIRKGTLPQLFTCEFCKIYKNTFSNRTASERWKIVKPITLQRNFLTQVTGNRVSDYYAKKHAYKGLSINSCSVDVTAIKNTWSKQIICSKIPTISAVQVFSTELHL